MAPAPRRSFQSGWAAYYRIEGIGNMARAQIHHVGQNAPSRTVCVSKTSTMCSLTQPRTRPMPRTGGTGDRIDRDRHRRPEATLILVGRYCAPAQKAMAGGRLYRASKGPIVRNFYFIGQTAPAIAACCGKIVTNLPPIYCSNTGSAALIARRVATHHPTAIQLELTSAFATGSRTRRLHFTCRPSRPRP